MAHGSDSLSWPAGPQLRPNFHRCSPSDWLCSRTVPGVTNWAVPRHQAASATRVVTWPYPTARAPDSAFENFAPGHTPARPRFLCRSFARI